MNVTALQKAALILALFTIAIFSWSKIYFRAEHERGLSSQTSPKFFIENAQVRRFNSSGRLEFTLNADTVFGSEDGTSFRLTRPHVVHNTSTQAIGVTSADSGEMLQRDELDLLGNVTLSFTPHGKRPKTTAMENYQKALDLTLMSAVHLIQGVTPAMQTKGWGRIIAITSISVKQPIGTLILSNMARAGLTGFLKTMQDVRYRLMLKPVKG